MSATSKLDHHRAEAMTRDRLDHFYNILHESFKDNSTEILENIVWNCDEAGFCHTPGNLMVIVERGVRNVHKKTYGNGREYTTIHACINASGRYLEPLIIYKNKKPYEPSKDDWKEAHFAPSPSGWMNSEIFSNWFRTVFVPEAEKSRPIGYEGPLFLILDGHTSHTTYDVIKTARDHNIELIRLPSHSTHMNASIIKKAYL